MKITPQEKVILVGIAAAAVAKFYFHKTYAIAALVGLSAIAAHDILTAREQTANDSEA